VTDTITLPLHRVTIDRGRDVLTVEVPEHEIDVLRAVHGVAEVRDLGAGDDEITLDANADAEWNRLQRRYKRINAADPVIVAYRTGPSGLKARGFALGRGAVEAAPQAGVRKHDKPKAEPSAKKKAE
jgi:hypothetical protein